MYVRFKKQEKKMMIPKDQYSKHVYTQLKSNLIVNNIYKDDINFIVSFSVNNIVGNKFLLENWRTPLLALVYVSVLFSDVYNTLSFVCPKNHIKTKDNFKELLLKTIDDNQLSYLNIDKKSVITEYIQKRVMETDIDYYQLNKMYDESINKLIAIELLEDKNKIKIGNNLNFIVKRGHFIIELINKMNELERNTNNNFPIQ
jgi:hypothetical protein